MATSAFTDYLAISSPVVTPVVWASGLLLGFVLCTVAATVLIRLDHLRHERNRRRIASVWLPIITRIAGAETPTIPGLRRADRPVVLELWVDTRRLLRGAPGERLDRLAA